MTETVADPQLPAARPAARSGLLITALIVSIVALVLGASGLTFGIIERSNVTSKSHQITRLQGQQKRLTREIAAIQPKLNGEHRNVITCGDMQTYINSLPQYDSAGDWIGGGSTLGMATLPAHCINR